jgi:PIN domain
MTRLTATDLLLADAEALRAGIAELAARSTVTHFNPVTDSVVWFGPTGEWSELDLDRLRLQSRVLEDYQRFFETLQVLLRPQPANALADLAEADGEIRAFLQRETTFRKTAQEAGEYALEAIAKQAELLQRLHDVGGGTDIFLPDTNALLHNPALEDWVFDSSSTFELVLSPAILIELDELKINRRNEDVRAKAETLISRIKGYRTRGQLTAGVPLRKSVSAIRLLAAEPRMNDSLSWLDPTNRDDRFLASTIEVIRQHPRSAVTIVTRDIKLQNKAELARLPFVEPPDPPPESIRPKRPPRPDVRFVRFGDGDGSEDWITFRADLQNYELKPVHATVTAVIEERDIESQPSEVNLLGNAEPTTISVRVPRPALADKVKEFAGETTLYGRELEVTVVTTADPTGQPPLSTRTTPPLPHRSFPAPTG